MQDMPNMGIGRKALYCFEHMQHEGCMANSVTFLAILKACGHLVAGKTRPNSPCEDFEKRDYLKRM